MLASLHVGPRRTSTPSPPRYSFSLTTPSSDLPGRSSFLSGTATHQAPPRVRASQPGRSTCVERPGWRSSRARILSAVEVVGVRRSRIWLTVLRAIVSSIVPLVAVSLIPISFASPVSALEDTAPERGRKQQAKCCNHGEPLHRVPPRCGNAAGPEKAGASDMPREKLRSEPRKPGVGEPPCAAGCVTATWGMKRPSRPCTAGTGQGPHATRALARSGERKRSRSWPAS